MNHTTIQQCFCESIILFKKIGIQFQVILNDVIVSNNSAPLLKSQDVEVTVSFTGSNLFYYNNDFIIHTDKSKILFAQTQVYFVNNKVTSAAVQGTLIYATDSKITFEECNVEFRRNQGSLSGGIAAESTQITFKDNATVDFIRNTGLNGGALSLYTGSRLTFNASQSNITLRFENNTARTGGAIYVDDNGYTGIESIFDLQCEPSYVKVKFVRGNVASFSGNQIYGGWIDWFANKALGDGPKRDTDMTSQFVELSNSGVSSNPIRICLCENDKPNCGAISSNRTMVIYGRALTLNLAGIGQRFTPIISIVEASLTNTHGRKFDSIIISRLVSLQSDCTKITYQIEYQSGEEIIKLKPYLPYLYYSSHSNDLQVHGIDHDLFQQLTIKLKVYQCPWGFHLNNNGSCECQLSIRNLHCDMDNYAIYRSKQQWIGATYEHNQDPGVIFHQHCPFDYCRSDDDSLSIRLEN